MRQPNQVTERNENFSENWMKLIKYSKSYWPPLLFAVLLSTGGNILTVLAPTQLGRLTNIIQEGIQSTIDMGAVTKIGLLLIALFGFGGLFTLIQGWIMASVTQNISMNLRTDISEKINRLPMFYFSNTTVGDTLSRVTNDVDTIGRALNMSVQNLISSGTMIAGSLVMMFITNRPLITKLLR